MYIGRDEYKEKENVLSGDKRTILAHKEERKDKEIIQECYWIGNVHFVKEKASK